MFGSARNQKIGSLHKGNFNDLVSDKTFTDHTSQELYMFTHAWYLALPNVYSS